MRGARRGKGIRAPRHRIDIKTCLAYEEAHRGAWKSERLI
jgi:hypothetical protein